MENEISQIILSCYKTNKLIFKTQGNQSMTDPPMPTEKGKGTFHWKLVVLAFERACARARKALGLLELRQYENDGIAERNLFILNLPRFSLALYSEGKRVSISK